MAALSLFDLTLVRSAALSPIGVVKKLSLSTNISTSTTFRLSFYGHTVLCYLVSSKFADGKSPFASIRMMENL